MNSLLTLRTDAGDEDLDLAEFEARAQRGEVTPDTLVRIPALTRDRFVPARELGLLQTGPWRIRFPRKVGVERVPLITLAVALVQVLVYAVTASAGALDVDAMVRFGAKVGPLVSELGQGWRLVTANFLHRDAVHLGFNLLVFLYVGTALEGAYRRRAYLLVLWASGLATMSASLVWTEAVSVGGSGLVYGCLGGLVVFGVRYRRVLPPRYRRLFGEAAVPTVLIFLWMGWTSAGVDNAGHFGGLVAGLLVTSFLTPRFLEEQEVEARSPWKMAVCVLSLGVLAPVAAVAWRSGWKREQDDDFGVSVSLPRDWRRGADRLGRLAFSNGLPGLGRATFAAEAVETGEPGDASAQARRFRAENAGAARWGEPAPAVVGGRSGVWLRGQGEEDVQPVSFEAYFVPRGELVYQLVFTYPVHFPRYASTVRRMVNELRFEEPGALREARAGALLVPGAPGALTVLGETLRHWGEVEAAIEVLSQAVRLGPANLEARLQLARAWLQAGKVDEGCATSADALLYAPGNPAGLETAARCELARGNARLALERLQDAVRAAPEDERLQAAAAALKATLEKQDAP